MDWSSIDWRPPPRVLRQFALLWLLFFAATATWQALARGNQFAALICACVGALVASAGLTWPASIRWLYLGAILVTFPIGWVMGHVALAIIFYGLFTPLGFLLRMMGGDPLQGKPAPRDNSYWRPKPALTEVDRYFRQF